MVVKRIKNPHNTSSKATRIRRLTDYIRAPENANAHEKCLYAGARGFLTDKPSSQTAEMLALSEESVRSKDTINHYVLSWREGEDPTEENIEEAVTIFLTELDLLGHQVIYGLHADTDNIHLHLAINRVHPISLKAILPHKGFDIEACHRAIARIEHSQNWAREANGRYQLQRDGELTKTVVAADRPSQPEQSKRDMENRTGEQSAHRIAINEATVLINSSTSWQQLHNELALKGMSYETVGSGAVVFVGDIAVKASAVDRGASLGKLQRRLGPYEPTLSSDLLHKPEPIPLKKDVPGWPDFIAARTVRYAAKRVAVLALRHQHEVERYALLVEQKARRRELLSAQWKGKGALRNALQSVLAAEQATSKATLKERHSQERRGLQQRFMPWPDLETWLTQQGQPELALNWCFRESTGPYIEGNSSECAMELPTPRDIRAFRAEVHGSSVRYILKDGRELTPSFTDVGRRIDVHQWESRDTVLAALQLASQKWGGFEVYGNTAYKALCVSLAAEHGFKITNPELQPYIELERVRYRESAELHLNVGSSPC